MLPEGVTIAHASRVAVKAARRIAPWWLHVDEVDSAAGDGLMRAIDGFRGGNRHQFWACVAASVRNPVRAAVREWRRHGVVFSSRHQKPDFQPEGMPASTITTPPHQAMARELVAMLTPTEYETAWAVEGGTAREAGERLGLTAAGVNVRLHRIRKRLESLA